ncbi:MAG: DUF6340 family protein [Marinifilaceae bacterium]|nr:DUF6340 family protein [Marinifilaceae bacterium]
MNKYLQFIICIVVFSSCSPVSKLAMNYYDPPKIPIPEEVTSIAFVIRHPLTQKQFDVIKSSKAMKQNYVANQSIIETCFDGFYDNLKMDVRFNQIMFYNKDAEVVKSLDSIPNLNWIQVDNICKKTRSDILIVLEDVSILASNTKKSSVKINWKYKFKIYDPFKFKIIDKYIISGSEREWINNGLTIRDILIDNAYEAGKKYARRLKRNYHSSLRVYFSKGNKYVKLGAYYLQNGDYYSAKKVWTLALKKNPNKNIIHRLYFNIALVDEYLKDFKNAKKNLDKSLDYIKSSKYIQKDKEIINKRIKQLAKRYQKK